MFRHQPLSAAGLTQRGSWLAVAALCGASGAATQAAVLVDLDATQLPEGPLPTWTNTGATAGDFASSGTAVPAVTTTGGVKSVLFTGAANNYLGPVAPDSINANDPNGLGARTIEAWVFNPSGSDLETLIAWGRREGPDNTNAAFSHGVHPTWGAFAGWGAGDIGWNGQLIFGD